MGWLVVSMVVLASPQGVPTAVDPIKALTTAQRDYSFGNYEKVISEVTPLVEPELLLDQVKDQVEAYRLLGLSHHFLKKTDKARAFFGRLIRLRPDFKLNAVMTPSDAIEAFEEVQQALREEIEKRRIELEKRKLEEARRRLEENTRYVTWQVNSRLVASLPFGAGQFQNRDPVLGAIFLGTEVAAISVSVASYLAVESLRGADGRFRNADVSQARAYQRLQVYTGAAALTLMVAGIAEALISFEPRFKLKERQGRPLGLEAGLTPGGFSVRF